jgi:nicotinamidase-related amidase
VPHVDVADCVLIVIDAQDGFYGAHRADVDRVAMSRALDRIAWVGAVASALGIPAVVTEEEPDTNGRTLAAITSSLPAATRVWDKPVFGANDNPQIDAAVRATDRGTAVLVGMETDVCVAHSALGWTEAGLRVVVVRDAVYSAGEGHEFGLARLVEAGVELISAKELYYEWLRTLAAVREFEAAHPELAEPPGFAL